MWNAEKSHKVVLPEPGPEGIRPHYRSLKVLHGGCCAQIAALFSH